MLCENTVREQRRLSFSVSCSWCSSRKKLRSIRWVTGKVKCTRTLSNVADASNEYVTAVVQYCRKLNGCTTHNSVSIVTISVNLKANATRSLAPARADSVKRASPCRQSAANVCHRNDVGLTRPVRVLEISVGIIERCPGVNYLHQTRRNEEEIGERLAL